MMVLILVPGVLAQDVAEDTDSLVVAMQDLRTEVVSVCDTAVKDYRAEAVREIESRMGDIKNEIALFLKVQRLIIIVGIIVASFLGTMVALVATMTYQKNRQRTFEEKMLQLLRREFHEHSERMASLKIHVAEAKITGTPELVVSTKGPSAGIPMGNDGEVMD